MGGTKPEGLEKHWTFLVAQRVKNLSAVHKTPVPFLGREDPLGNG